MYYNIHIKESQFFILGSANAVKLDNVLIGLVIGRMGTLFPLPERHSNLFVHDMETPIMDISHKKPFCSGQKHFLTSFLCILARKTGYLVAQVKLVSSYYS